MAFTIYALGPVCASVCTDLTIQEATEKLNEQAPTGITSSWSLSEDKAFLDGTPNGGACDQESDKYKHYLFNC